MPGWRKKSGLTFEVLSWFFFFVAPEQDMGQLEARSDIGSEAGPGAAVPMHASEPERARRRRDVSKIPVRKKAWWAWMTW